MSVPPRFKYSAVSAFLYTACEPDGLHVSARTSAVPYGATHVAYSYIHPRPRRAIEVQAGWARRPWGSTRECPTSVVAAPLRRLAAPRGALRRQGRLAFSSITFAVGRAAYILEVKPKT